MLLVSKSYEKKIKIAFGSVVKVVPYLVCLNVQSENQILNGVYYLSTLKLLIISHEIEGE